MKKANILAASLTLALTIPSVSFANSLTGFNISGEIQFKSNGGTISGPGVKQSYGGEQDVILGINVGYTFGLGNRMALQAGVAADLGDTAAYKLRATSFAKTDGTMKNQYSAYIAPGYIVNQQTTIYGKLSVNSVKAEYKLNSGVTEKYSSKHTGIGYGAGVRTAISDSMFFYTEALHADYNKKQMGNSNVKLKPSSTVARIGFGYRF